MHRNRSPLTLRRLLSLAPLALLALLAPLTPAQLTVTQVTPARNANAAPTAGAIQVTFASAVNPATVTAASFRVFGRWSGVGRGTLSLSNGNRTVTFAPSRPFFVGEQVTVNLSSAIAGAAGALTGGHAWQLNTRSARGTSSFAWQGLQSVRRPNEPRTRLYGAYAGDLDGDGAPDLSMPNEDANDVRTLRNDGCGGYSGLTVYPLPTAAKPSTNEGQDLDGDGNFDFAVGNIAANSMSVLLGDGAGGFKAAVTYPSGRGTRGLAVLDADGDGDIDVVTANRVTSNLALHRNNGDGTFAAATFFEGGGDGETGVVAADANGDGILDLMVASLTSQHVTLLLGDGAGGFTLSATATVDGEPWMITAGDMDGDGHMDAITCNSSKPRISVVRGNGAGGFHPAVSYTVGTWPLAIEVGDVDGDGDLDAVSSNFLGVDWTLLRNDGTGALGAATTFKANGAGSCAVLVDYDRDGDVDILGMDEIDDEVFFFRQDGPSPGGVQGPGCAAALRVDNLANRGGLGAAAPHAVTSGGTFFLGVSTAPQRSYAVAVGVGVAPGAALPFGILNVAAAPLLFLPGRTTDGHGEDLQALQVPIGLWPGVHATLQGFVVDAGLPAGGILTNPERILVQ